MNQAWADSGLTTFSTHWRQFSIPRRETLSIVIRLKAYGEDLDFACPRMRGSLG